MTDRHAGYVVSLDKDIREDDAELIINAIRMIKHVVSVEPIVSDVTTIMAYAKARADLTEKLLGALK